MPMSRKDFIVIADEIKEYARLSGTNEPFTGTQLATLAQAFQRCNPNFDAVRWLDYVEGGRGPNGGEIKTKKAVDNQ